MLNKTLKKILVLILIVLLLNNFIISNVVYAAGESEVEKFLTKMLGTVVGWFTYPIRLVAIGLAHGMQSLTASVAYCDTPSTDGGSAQDTSTISPYDILFNKVGMLDINFFDVTNEDTIVMTIRRGVATWYNAMRLVASAILLAVLVYVGIRMAISTIASDRAVYNKMLTDWAVSLALIFLLSFIIVFVIHVNSALVSTIEAFVTSNASSSNNSDSINAAIDAIGEIATSGSVDGIAATIVYVLIAWQTLGLLISYFSRMLKLAFLLIIAPLITLTYAIDKMGDGKAQALNAWLKEFIFTVLIQPFHCIIYAVLISMSFELLTNDGVNKLAAGLIAVLCIKFVKEAEDIVRKIFSFADDNKNTSLAAGAATAMLGMKYASGAGKSVGMFAGKAVNTATNVFKNRGEIMANMGANAYALRTIVGSGGKTFQERKDDYMESHDNASADKDERKLDSYEKKDLANAGSEEEKAKIKKKYSAMRNNMDKAVSARAAALMNSDPTLTASRAKARARSEMAKQYRTQEKNSRESGTLRSIKGFTSGAVNGFRNSQVVKEIGKMAKFQAGAGVAVFMGAGSYANDGNAFVAIGSGVASYKAVSSGVDSFFQHTGGTLAQNTKNNFVALGATDSTKIMEIANRIMANGDDYEDGDKLKELVDDLKEQLRKAGLDEKQVSNIHNHIKKGIASGTPFNPDTLVKGILGESKTNPAILQASRKLSNFENEKNIYNAMKTSEDLGRSNATFISDITGRTTDKDFRDAKAFVYDDSTDIESSARTEDMDFSGMSVDEKKNAQRDIDRALENAKKQQDSQRGYGVESSALEREIEQLEKNKLKVQMELKIEFEKNARELSKQLVEIKKEISKEVAKEKAKLVLDKETFMREIEREAANREKEIEDLKRSAETIEIPGIRQKIALKENELNIFKNNSTAVINEVKE